MLRIAIYEQDTATDWAAYVQRYSSEKELDCTVQRVGAIVETSGQEAFDAMFVATDGGDVEGIAMARRLREANPAMQLVLIVGDAPFVIKEKQVDAMDVLVRPITYHAFATMLDRIQIRIAKTDVPYFALMTKKGMRRVSVDDITYIEGGLNLVYHMTDGDVRAHGSLNEVEKKLTADRFFRLGGYLINLRHVHKVSGADVYVGTACLPLPFSKKAALLHSLLAFHNRG